MEQQKNMLNHIKPVKVEVPDDQFFTGLAKSIVEKNPRKEAFVRSINWKRISLIALSSAAILVVGFLLLDQNKNQDLNQDFSVSLAELEKSEIENYINENHKDFDRDSIIEELEAEELFSSDNVESNTQNLEQLFSALTLKEIDQYFKAEGIDPEEPEEDELLY